MNKIGRCKVGGWCSALKTDTCINIDFNTSLIIRLQAYLLLISFRNFMQFSLIITLTKTPWLKAINDPPSMYCNLLLADNTYFSSTDTDWCTRKPKYKLKYVLVGSYVKWVWRKIIFLFWKYSFWNKRIVIIMNASIFHSRRERFFGIMKKNGESYYVVLVKTWAWKWICVPKFWKSNSRDIAI